MNNQIGTDYVAVISVIAASLTGIVFIIHESRRKGLKKSGIAPSKQTIIIVFFGLALVLLSALGNSIFENRWDWIFIVSFLFLKTIGSEWFFRYVCSIGYVFIIYGIAFGAFALYSRND